MCVVRGIDYGAAVAYERSLRLFVNPGEEELLRIFVVKEIAEDCWCQFVNSSHHQWADDAVVCGEHTDVLAEILSLVNAVDGYATAILVLVCVIVGASRQH